MFIHEILIISCRDAHLIHFHSSAPHIVRVESVTGCRTCFVPCSGLSASTEISKGPRSYPFQKCQPLPAPFSGLCLPRVTCCWRHNSDVARKLTGRCNLDTIERSIHEYAAARTSVDACERSNTNGRPTEGAPLGLMVRQVLCVLFYVKYPHYRVAHVP